VKPIGAKNKCKKRGRGEAITKIETQKRQQRVNKKKKKTKIRRQ
jgi:hypothetical protein